MADPLKITIALKDEQQGAPPPVRLARQRGAAGPAGGGLAGDQGDWSPDDDELFSTEREKWRGKYDPFTATRQASMALEAGKTVGQLMRGNLRGAGQSAKKAAGLYVGEASGASEASALVKGLGGGAALAQGAGIAVGALVKFAEWVKKSSDALEALAKTYGAYSPQVSVAMAERDVKETMFQINQAEKYGQQLAEQVSARTDLGIEFDKLSDSFTMIFAPLTTMLENGLAGVLKGLNTLIGNSEADQFKSLRELLDKQLEQMLDLQRDADLEKAQAAADAGIAPIQQWMLDQGDARKKRRERERRAADARVAAAGPAKAPGPGQQWQFFWPWERK